MSRRDIAFLNMAAKIAAMGSKDPSRIFFLGCVGIRSDGAIVKGRNQSAKNSPIIDQKRPNRTAHAEYRVANKLDYGAEIFVARIRPGDESWGMARPCLNCMKILRTKKVERVCYTISPQEYGVMYL